MGGVGVRSHSRHILWGGGSPHLQAGWHQSIQLVSMEGFPSLAVTLLNTLPQEV